MSFNKNNYIHIEGWMITELGLKSNELLAYAIIYGFTQDGESLYQGSSKYIADALQIARKTAVNTLDRLCEKKLIIKSQEKINDVIFNRYKVLPNPMQNLHRGLCKNDIGGLCKNDIGGYVKITHSNTNRITNSNTKGNNNIAFFPQDEKLNATFLDYVEMRKRIKKPLVTDRQLKIAISNIEKYSKDEFGNMDNDKAIKVIEQSLGGSWSGIYPLKEDKQERTTNRYKEIDNWV